MKDRSSAPRRSMLFVPASNASMLSNVYIYKPDAVMLDVEDGVAPREKDSARLMMFHALSSPAYKDLYTVVRINALDTPWGMLDLEAAVRGGADVIRLPMTSCADDIRRLEREVERIERECGRPVGDTRLQAAIESAAGVMNALEIAQASDRMDSIALAAFDYVVDLQTTRGDGTELFFARCMILHAARVAKIDCYDAVYGDVNDEEGFLKEVELAKKLGFNGKSLINPRQIEPLHNAYAPTEAELAHAYLVVEAAERAEREGLGVVSLGGKMVDAPIIATARRTIQYADASGVRR